MKFKTFLASLLLVSVFPSSVLADIKISQLPLGTAAAAGANDSFPYVDFASSITKRMKIFDLINLPAFGSQFAPIASPTFTGTVTGPTFVGALTGNSSTSTALASVPTHCTSPQFALGIGANGNAICDTPLGSGTVTSVAMTVPVWLSVSGSPITTTGTLVVTGSSQNANLVLASPNGTTGAVSPRSLVGADLPNPSASTLGGIESYAAVTNQWINTISTSGVPSSSQPAFSNISGSVASTQMPALTGDVTSSAGTVSTSISNLARSKLAAGTANHVVINDGSGVLSSEATLAKSRGGTGQDNSSLTFPSSGTVQAITPAAHGVLVSGSGATASVTAAGTSGQPLLSGGAGSDPAYGTLTPSFGGLGTTSLTAHGVVIGNGTSTASVTSAGSSGQVLTSNGASADPTFQPAGSGTVTSVTFTGDGTVLSSTPSSAVTTSGTVTGSLNTQTKNKVLAGPTTGSNAAPTFRSVVAADLSPGFINPTVQKFTSTGSTVGYLFTVTSANATVGATYTNNSNTYTVLNTISAGTLLWASQASAPQASGTLTKSAGTGDATITFSVATAYATYTTASGVLYIRIRECGGGGGGGGSGTTTTGGAGGQGKGSFFGANLLVMGGGSGAANGNDGRGASASAQQSLGTGPIGLALAGTPGFSAAGLASASGGNGGSSPLFGGGGVGGQGGAGGTGGAGGVPNANTGSGGAGAGSGASTANGAAGGGASGDCVDAIINTPAATYPYIVGTGGAAGSAGTSGAAGSAGAAGLLEVEEFTQ